MIQTNQLLSGRTLRQTARLTREQRQSERQDERDALRIALIVELTINLLALKDNVDKLKNISDDEGALMPTKAIDDIYQSFVGRAGLLTRFEVEMIMYAYKSLETFRANLTLLGSREDFYDEHIYVPGQNTAVLAEASQNLMGHINRAIEAIRQFTTDE